ncbi:CDP-alcohol phosphatidyltransferase family protein [Alicyclobacillus sp.]|uniref:CDP-alcohol phosphatidyltransferase family protein n=1 Tax=Alicyclobacillus sp. TaxID=61169 RepID=UPI0025C6AC5B|nr:CDP-alcohol phosphatidyltransferase family protein [Alicyclobacillus sp.]MCL6517143.1 CDP-alcohol phosphatidyltransferase family protein [Alicyclobacillus sp.]
MSDTLRTAPDGTEVRTEFQKINACAKRPVDIWTNYLYYPFSLRLVYLIRNTRITPNMLTLGSLALALLGCLYYARGDRAALTLGLVLSQMSYVIDCADGQLARYRKQYSPIGGWLDQIADRIKEFALYFSLAWGYTRVHPSAQHVWRWAMVALFALFLLEYLSQTEMFRVNGLPRRYNENGVPIEDTPQADAGDRFEQARRLRALIPFKAFTIGEQYFAQLVFIAFGWVYSFFVFVSILGLLMAVYRPLVEYVKHRRMVRRNQAAANSPQSS